MVEYCTINTTTRNLNWPTQPDVLAFSRNTWDCFCHWHRSANPMVPTPVSSYFDALASRAFVKNRGNALATSNTKGLGQTSWIRSVPSALLRSALNAFAVGNRQEGGIAVTGGLLRTLSYREIRAVLAHEMIHLQHNDVSVMLLSSIVGRLVHWLAWFGIALILFSLPLSWLYGQTVPWFWLLMLMAAPWLSLLLQAGLSRTREFQADLGATRLTDDPQALIQALTKINPGSSAPVHSGVLTLLRSHPATSERIARLASISQAVWEPRDFLWCDFNRPNYLSWTKRRYGWQ